MDLTNITTIAKSSTQKQNFDLRFTLSNSKFQVSDSFFASHNLENNGFQFHLGQDQGRKVPLLSIHPVEDSYFFKGEDTKFSYNILEDTLNDLGMVSEEKTTEFSLREVGKVEEVVYFEIVPWETEKSDDVEAYDEEADSNNASTESPEIVDDSEDASMEEETVLAEESVEEEEEDPFA